MTPAFHTVLFDGMALCASQEPPSTAPSKNRWPISASPSRSPNIRPSTLPPGTGCTKPSGFPANPGSSATSAGCITTMAKNRTCCPEPASSSSGPPAGSKLGIVTGANRDRIRVEFQRLGLAFPAIVCHEDVEQRKPHPEGITQALALLNTGTEACCFVGDAPEDIEMGKRAGVFTIGVVSD